MTDAGARRVVLTKPDYLKEYCGRGWKLHPFQPRDKVPMLKDWQNKATDDWVVVERWLKQWPSANWGIVLGRSGLAVIDEDHGPAPKEWNLPPTLTVKTGRTDGPGLHHYYISSNGAESGKYEWGELRTGDNSVLVPPSVHPSGAEYRWVGDLLNDEIAGLPHISPSGADAASQTKSKTGPLKDGERHNALYALASTLRGAGKEYGEILALLAVANAARCEPLLPSQDLEQMAANVRKYEADKNETLSDEGNAIRLVKKFGDEIRFVHGTDTWLIWDGARWKEDKVGAIYRLASQVAEDLLADAEAETRSEEWKAAKKANAKRMQSRQGVDACLYMARTFPQVAITPEQIDNAPYILNCLNGQVNLRTGELTPHSREPIITKLVGVEFDPGAQCPRFLGCLGDWFGDDDDTKKTLQTAAGAAITGSGGEQGFMYLHGRGKNGKTSWLRLMGTIFKDYTTHVPVAIFLTSRGGDPSEGPSPYTAKMFNARFVMTTEVPKNRQINTKLKDSSGGDTVSTRGLHQDPFDLVQTWIVWLFGNHLLSTGGDETEGLWRKINLVTFPNTIPEKKRIRSVFDFVEGLRPEFPGILAWVVEGAKIWSKSGLFVSKAVSDATKAYRKAEDVLGQYMELYSEMGTGFSVDKTQFNKGYKAFAIDEDGFALGQKAVTARLRDEGIKVGGHGKKDYVGIRLLAEPKDIPEDTPEPEPMPAQEEIPF